MSTAPVALVTGASRGIGRAIALALAADGWQVAVNSHTHPDEGAAVRDLIRASGGMASHVTGDVRNRTSMHAICERTRRELGPICGFVHNAGIALQQLYTETAEAEWDSLFAVHVKGAYHGCQEVLPDMIRANVGSIVVVTSIWGLAGSSCEVAYSAAKHAQVGLVRALAMEAGPSGVRVNGVAPGLIETAMNDGLDAATRADLKARIPLGRIGQPEEVAALVRFLMSPAAGYLTGQIIACDGGWV